MQGLTKALRKTMRFTGWTKQPVRHHSSMLCTSALRLQEASVYLVSAHVRKAETIVSIECPLNTVRQPCVTWPLLVQDDELPESQKQALCLRSCSCGGYEGRRIAGRTGLVIGRPVCKIQRQLSSWLKCRCANCVGSLMEGLT